MSKEKGKVWLASIRATDEIISDLGDRRGVGHEWHAIEPAIRGDIREAWRAIIERSIRVTLGMPNESNGQGESNG